MYFTRYTQTASPIFQTGWAPVCTPGHPQPSILPCNQYSVSIFICKRLRSIIIKPNIHISHFFNCVNTILKIHCSYTIKRFIIVRMIHRRTCDYPFPIQFKHIRTFHHGSQFTVGFQHISLVLPIIKIIRFIQANTTISICNGTSYASANHHIPSSIVFKHLGITKIIGKSLWRLFYYRITFIFFKIHTIF